jgi:hypothetical protein
VAQPPTSNDNFGLEHDLPNRLTSDILHFSFHGWDNHFHGWDNHFHGWLGVPVFKLVKPISGGTCCTATDPR